MAAIMVFQNNEVADMLGTKPYPVGVELFFYVNTFFCSNKFTWLLASNLVPRVFSLGTRLVGHVSKNAQKKRNP